ncbi:MAG TPA: PQQ-binding-like beta-propeller repeat protein [Capsulimonadaceae bacterium]|jgi:outer membrane protein assembly factor BamB
MLNIRTHLLALPALLLLLVAPQSRADFETFDQYRGNAQHTGFVDVELSPKLALAWQNSQTRSSGSSAPPVIFGGVLFYGLGQKFYALDTVTGALKWQYPAANDSSTQVAGFNCPPLLADGKIFAGNDDGNLYCFDATSGKIVWKFHTQANIHVAPVIQEGSLYFGSGNQLFALDSNTGHELWNQPCYVQSPVIAGPTINNGTLFVVDGTGRLYSINALAGRMIRSNFYTGSPTLAAALVLDNGKIFIRSGRLITKVNTRDLSPAISFTTTGEVTEPPTISDDGVTFVVTSDQKVTAYDTRGRTTWTKKLDEAVSAPPLLTRNSLVVTTRMGVIYLLDRASGDIQWVYTLTPAVRPGDTPPAVSPVIISPVVADGALYVIADDGTVSAFRPNAPDNSIPVVTGLYPAPDSTISGKEIPWQVTLSDMGSGIDPASINLAVDGQDVPTQYDPNQQEVHVKLEPLNGQLINMLPVHLPTLSDGAHKAVLVVADYRGNKTIKTWTFRVDKNQPPPTGVAPSPVATGAPTVSADNNATSQPTSSSITAAPSTSGGTATPAIATPTTGGATRSSGGATLVPATPNASTAPQATPATPNSNTQTPTTNNGGGGTGAAPSSGAPPPPPPI